MATVGSLLVVLRGDTSPLTHSFRAAEVATSRFAGAFTNKLVGTAVVLQGITAATQELSRALEEVYFKGGSATDVLVAMGEALVKSLQAAPVAGGLGTAAGLGIDKLLGNLARGEGPMMEEFLRLEAQARADEQHRQRATEAQRAIARDQAEAERLTRSMMSAFEQQNASIIRARELFEAGRITIETYNRVLADTPQVIDMTGAPLNEMIGALQEQAATLGMTARQLSVYRAAQQGAGAAALAAVNAVHDLIDAQKAALDMQAAANRVIEETRSPLENYEQGITELNDLLAAGRISWEVYGRGVRMARQELEELLRRSPAESALMGLGVGGIDVGAAGSFAGRNVIDRSRDQVADNTKRQLELTQRELQHLESIDSKIQREPIIVQEVTI